MSEKSNPTESGFPNQEQFRKYVDDFLASATPGFEETFNSAAFGEFLGKSLGNVVAMSRMNDDAMDATLRHMRIAGRSDVVSLHRQLHRIEDKLEMMLESIERIEDTIAQNRRGPTKNSNG